jgi:hypothetical protein
VNAMPAASRSSRRRGDADARISGTYKSYSRALNGHRARCDDGLFV